MSKYNNEQLEIAALYYLVRANDVTLRAEVNKDKVDVRFNTFDNRKVSISFYENATPSMRDLEDSDFEVPLVKEIVNVFLQVCRNDHTDKIVHLFRMHNRPNSNMFKILKG